MAVLFTACHPSAVELNFTSYNVDWEPTSPNITADDAVQYAQFLDAFATAMHGVGKHVSVDVATWWVAR